MRRRFAVLCSAAAFGCAYAQTVVRISPRPPASVQEIVDLESRVRANPQDLEARAQLLGDYFAIAPEPPIDDPQRRLARLDHILYLIDHFPDMQILATPVAYIAARRGIYANPNDHQVARAQWFSALDSHPRNVAAIVNAARFLAVEDKTEAEDVLKNGIAAAPENRELPANLGFLYAMEILGLDSLRFGAKSSMLDPELAAHARAELERTSNAFVLAGAGTAIPNLAGKAIPGPADPALFDLASTLSRRARQLAPADPEIQGPMPLIRYFAAAHEPVAFESRAYNPVPGNTQTAALIRKTKPLYPKAAMSAGITGAVRLRVVIARDGTVNSVQAVSGHPMLADAAIEAVKTWLYKPTTLNGIPVELITEVTVQFPPE
jgi:TonB family protein